MSTWEGIWDTSFGELNLKQNGSIVKGDYSTVGIIEGVSSTSGSVSILEGKFTNSNVGKNGKFKFISEVNGTFKGKWRWDHDHNWQSSSWVGEINNTTTTISTPIFRSINPATLMIDGVFEGGGTLGAAYIGSLRALSDANVWFSSLAGNSAGAITAALIAVGYTYDEIHWLTSPSTITKPSSMLNVEPITFSDFLDIPAGASNISQTTRRNTYLWKALKGEIIDNIKNIKIADFPSRDKLASDIVDDIIKIVAPVGAVKDQVKNIIKLALPFIPNNASSIKIKDFVIFDTETLRVKFADEVWKAIVNINPSYRILINLIYEGGICEGKVFYNTIKNLLSIKKYGIGATQDVKFKDLKIPLSLIATDTKNKKMIVYSSKETPNKSVARAVRESMSIPFLFEPVGTNEIVDGGLCSNYPYWVYSEGLDIKYFDSSDIDIDRVKIGFILDKYAKPKTAWNTVPSKYTSNSNPRNPLSLEVLSDNMLAKYNFEISHNSELGSQLNLLNNVFEVSGKDHLHTIISSSLMKNRKFYEVNIPVEGYHWLDFQVAENNVHFNGIAERGWHSTIATLKKNNLVALNTTNAWLLSHQNCPF